MADEHVAGPRPTTAPISLTQALGRGFRGRCPECGEGRMFRAFLKVVDRCPRCGEPLHYHRADDLPAYLVMAIVGHIVVGVTLWLEKNYQASFFTHAMIEFPLLIVLSLGLLQPIKGAVVALQWHAGMHGFPGARARVMLTGREVPETVPPA